MSSMWPPRHGRLSVLIDLFVPFPREVMQSCPVELRYVGDMLGQWNTEVHVSLPGGKAWPPILQEEAVPPETYVQWASNESKLF